jgi:hypothetical protein
MAAGPTVGGGFFTANSKNLGRTPNFYFFFLRASSRFRAVPRSRVMGQSAPIDLRRMFTLKSSSHSTLVAAATATSLHRGPTGPSWATSSLRRRPRILSLSPPHRRIAASPLRCGLRRRFAAAAADISSPSSPPPYRLRGHHHRCGAQ